MGHAICATISDMEQRWVKATSAERLASTVARRIDWLIARTRGFVGRQLDGAQRRLRGVGAHPMVDSEYNALGPMTITAERAAALERLWETERV